MVTKENEQNRPRSNDLRVTRWVALGEIATYPCLFFVDRDKVSRDPTITSKYWSEFSSGGMAFVWPPPYSPLFHLANLVPSRQYH